MLPVVEAGAPDGALVEREAERLDQVEEGAGGRDRCGRRCRCSSGSRARPGRRGDRILKPEEPRGVGMLDGTFPRRDVMGKPMKVVIGSLVVVAAAGLFLYSQKAAAKQEGLKTVEVARGTIVDKALAVGPDRSRSGDPGQVADLGHRRPGVRRGGRPGRGRPAALLDHARSDAARAGRGRARGRAGAGHLRQGRSRTSSAPAPCSRAASCRATSSTPARRTSTRRASGSSRPRTSARCSRRASSRGAAASPASTR